MWVSEIHEKKWKITKGHAECLPPMEKLIWKTQQYSIQNWREKNIYRSMRKELKLPVRTSQKVFVQSSSPDPSHHKLNILSSWSLFLLQYQCRLHMFPNEKDQILSLFQKLPQKTPRKNHTCWHLNHKSFQITVWKMQHFHMQNYQVTCS